jgi:hypothetical protein
MAKLVDFTGDNVIWKATDVVLNGTERNADGTVKDIAGWTIVLTVKKRATDAVFVLQKTAAIVNAAGGTYSFTFADEELTLPAAKYAYDIQRTDDDHVTVLAIGTFEVAQEVRVK